MPRKIKPSPVQSLEILRETVGEEHQEALDAIARRDYSQKERDNMDDSDFGDPENQAFPIKTAQDVINAASRLHNASGDQDAIKARIKRIAKRKGFPLPQTWQDEEKSERADNPDPQNPPKDPMTTVERSAPAAPPKDIQFYVPIERWDKDTREVVGTATQEVEDAYGTVIRYEASKDAFTRWAGNIREMHDKHKAVGRALEITPDDANKRIIVRATISTGAEDTWRKITEGVLTGFSIGGRNGTWSEMKVGERNVPALDRYDLAELSLVDNPGCPGSNDLVIVRSDGEMSQVLALNSEATPSEAAEAIERAGAKHSQSTRDALHDSAKHQMKGALQTMNNCGCEDCAKVASVLDPDNDGDIDFMGIADTDNDQGSPDADEADRVLRYMAPVYQRLQNIAAALMPSENDTHYQGLQRENQELRSQLADLKADLKTTTNELKASIERSASNQAVPDFIKSAFETLKADVSATKAQVDTIAKQPTPGGPALNAGALPPGISAAEKRFATQPGNSPSNNPDSTLDVLDRMQRAGALSSPEAQVAAAALAARPMRGYIG